MPNILVLGAGLSAHYLIEYLAKFVQETGGILTVADANAAALQEQLAPYDSTYVQGLALQLEDTEACLRLVRAHEVVVSLMPATLQVRVAEYCLQARKHLLTASYASPEMLKFAGEVKARDLFFLNEMGLDPGIDHLSAMHLIAKIQAAGGEITAFRSYAGALLAPEAETNPWRYKFTWNPRNVVLAGQGGAAKFLENGRTRYIPYNSLFKQIQTIQIADKGAFDAYANRDSLRYREAYQLNHVPTLLRGTLRRAGFCEAWAILVDLGLTDDSYQIENSAQLTYREWLEGYLPQSAAPWQARMAQLLGITWSNTLTQKIEYLDLMADELIGLPNATPAQILQQRLSQKWLLAPQDCDMIVMQHQFEYTQAGKQYRLCSDLAVTGKDSRHTAIAKTVGLPLAMATRRLLTGEITARGLLLPTLPEIYSPILNELETFGIVFSETITAV